MACLTAWPPITAPWVWLKPPRTDLARPVRAVETMTACFMRYPRIGRTLAVQAFGCQCGISKCESDGGGQGDDADRDAAVKRQVGIEGDRAVGGGHDGKTRHPCTGDQEIYPQ